MKLYLAQTKEQLGRSAAGMIARKLNRAIDEKGEARIVLSTGMSQFETFEALLQENVAWEKVTMFHLDEYVALPESHIASFRKYLKERFVSKVPLKEAVFVDGEGDVQENIRMLTQRIREKEVDVGVIGIGENAHIAFNDPPADFESREAYWVVTLDEKCRKQQVGEGWFAGVEDVPKEAISMTPYQIMQCKCVISPVPRAVKEWAVAAVLKSEKTDPMIPGTLLKTHEDFHLFVDKDSAGGCPEELLKEYQVQYV